MSGSGRLTVGVIGAGPVGVVLGQALANAGHLVAGISAVSAQNLDRVSAMLPQVELMDVPEILSSVDLVLLAIPAEQLEPTITGWAEAGLWRAGQIAVHTAAEYGIGVFTPATRQGVIPLAIHPAMRFTGTSVDLVRIRESYFGVTAPKVALPIAQALVIEMGGEPLVVAEEQRASYAEAMDVASSFSAMIVNQAIGLLTDIGLQEPRAVLGPLVRSSVEQALADGYRPLEPDNLIEGS
ncbi:MAG: Rossmann-like and DUF2520 domain-containing protein [Micrococcales bacterium]